MNSCFEKFVGFIRIISDGLVKIVALKNSVLFLTLSKLLKIMYFFLISSNYEYWGNFQSSYETKKSSMEKIMRLMLEEVIMSDGQMYSFLQLFFNTEKIRLN